MKQHLILDENDIAILKNNINCFVEVMHIYLRHSCEQMNLLFILCLQFSMLISNAILND